jgi:hypothetical protein
MFWVGLHTINIKVKVKLFLCFNWAPRHEGVLEEWWYSSTHSLTSALDGGQWSASRFGLFTPRKEPLVPIRTPELPIIQPVAQRYTAELSWLLRNVWKSFIIPRCWHILKTKHSLIFIKLQNLPQFIPSTLTHVAYFFSACGMSQNVILSFPSCRVSNAAWVSRLYDVLGMAQWRPVVTRVM